MPQQFTIIGMDDNATPRFSEQALVEIARGRIFSGGRRHRELVAPLLPAGAEWIEISVPLDRVFQAYQAHAKIVVFASGDPLFFGFGTTVHRRLPDARITIFPTFNSLQTLSHRIVMPYEDMRIVSLTGRPWHEFDRALIEGCGKIGILTDREHTPTAIAHRMLDYGYDTYVLWLGERLGGEQERIRRLSLQEAVATEAEAPNCLILEGVGRRRPFGIPESQFEPLDGRTRMITKMPVRLVTLSRLDLPARSHFWDVGFCTGSISVEARLQFPHLHIHSFEIRPEGAHLLEINARRFGAPGITAHIGDFLAADLDDLPAPDAVFIGGHGGKLRPIIRRITERLSPHGVIVFNSVSDDSRALFVEAIQEVGMILTEPIGLRVEGHNKIEILKATYPHES